SCPRSPAWGRGFWAGEGCCAAGLRCERRPPGPGELGRRENENAGDDDEENRDAEVDLLLGLAPGRTEFRRPPADHRAHGQHQRDRGREESDELEHGRRTIANGARGNQSRRVPIVRRIRRIIRYLNDSAMPLRSRLTISPVCRPASSRTAPF